MARRKKEPKSIHRENIASAAQLLFMEKGIKATSMEETNTFPKARLSGKKYMLFTACKTPSPFSWIFGQSRGAIRNMEEFFKTARMKCKGKFVCANAVNKNELPKSLVKQIERCWK